jgi:hypothetical protein
MPALIAAQLTPLIFNVAGSNKGLDNAYQVCEMVAQSLDIDTEQVLPFSTGVIGQPLPMQCFRDNIAKLSTRLASDHLSQVAQAILTATGNTCTRIGVATINNQSTHMIIKMVFCYHHRRSAKNILGKYCRCCGFRHKRDKTSVAIFYWRDWATPTNAVF